MKPNPEKGRRYIKSLDTARCNDNWQEVPELVRKIAKHAPERKCLVQTARAECQISEHVAKVAESSDSSSAPARDELLSLIPTLLSAAQEEGSSPQEIFQAQVCLGWLHWSLSESALAASRLPKDFEATLRALSSDGHELSPWTEICFIKGGYVKGAAQVNTSGTDAALRTLSAVFRYAIEFTPTKSPQYSYWSEQFLSKCSLLASEVATTQEAPSTATIEFALWAFRAWASHGDIKQSDPASAAGRKLADGLGSRYSMWKSYYQLLSVIVQRRLSYFPPADGPHRVQLSSEFRHVETVCENILLRNVKFPRAHAPNHQVETWVEQVIANWEVLCSHEWSDDDFGEGGQDAMSRNVLDILYRAATKTFHSTLILRRLFHVHSALAEFDLAMKAFDTYLDLVITAKNRAQNAGKPLERLEDDETLIRTLSECVLMLCCFGTRKEAEKANRLTDRLEKRLNALTEQYDSLHQSDSGTPTPVAYASPDGKTVSVSVIEGAYRAMGIGLANWARWTRVNESRTGIQEAAVASLEKSLATGSLDSVCSATAFALGLLLAEMRDVNGAINQVRTALMPVNETDDASQRSNTYSQDQELIPLWHLLALLLSARQEYETALGVCEAALELDSSSNVQDVGKDGHNSAFTSGIYDSKSRKKEVVVELRMTHLALTEILHGPEAAINRSDELFSSFRQLFTGLGVMEAGEKSKQDRLAPPKTATGTIGTFRSSIFRRNKTQKVVEHDGDTRSHGSAVQTRPISSNADSNLASTAPPLEVAGDELGPANDGPRPDSQRSPHKLRRGQGSLTKSSKGHTLEPSSPLQSHSRGYRRKDNEDTGTSTAVEGLSPTGGFDRSLTAKQTLPPVAHNMKYTKEPLPAGHTEQPPQQDVRLPSGGPSETPRKAATRFPRLHVQKNALGLLIKIWLFISGLYRRASLLDDAREACGEASEKASKLESFVAGKESSASAFADAGWGDRGSSDEYWADICTETGLIAEAGSRPHEAMENFEEALMYSPEHGRATVALSNLLLDIFDGTLPTEEPQEEPDAGISTLSLGSTVKLVGQAKAAEAPSMPNEDSLDELNRLAPRDRAYGLLSALTKSGSAWDDSDAWLALSRANEQGGQVEKAKEILWWCVELEDRRPIRHWMNVGLGGYVL